MRKKLHNPYSSSRKMTEDEIEIAQWRIAVTNRGEYKIEEIYSQEIWAEQADQKKFGGVFKKAVLSGELKDITLKMDGGYDILSSDGQLLYFVKY